MKKRKPCNSNQTRSPVNSSRSVAYSAASDVISQNSKSSQDLKRRCLKKNYGNVKKQRKIRSDGEDAFGSLESLFDVRRPLKLPELQPALTRNITHEPTYESSSSDSDNIRDLKSLITNLYGSSKLVEKESDIIVSSHSEESTNNEYDISNLEELNVEQENSHISSRESEDSLISDRFNNDMAEEEASLGMEDEKIPEPSAPPEDITTAQRPPDMSLSIEEIPEDPEGEPTIGNGELPIQEIPKPPEYPLPAGVGEGVPIKPGGHRESMISSNSLTNTQFIKDMKAQKERCKVVKEEIDEIKKNIAELRDKKDLKADDTKKIQEKQASLMKMMNEFNEITRNLSRSIGLIDPSSQIFAKLFEMLPYPHTPAKTLDKVFDKNKENINREEEKRKIIEKDDFENDCFDIPQPEYPEDKLPRAIVCGFTEDRMPKIVIPDSRPKGTRCLKNLTGKLSESLNMQEKLVQENAKLEGGKYKLEEALLEKDAAVDSLQRKLCGVQAEMRIVMKENSELRLASENSQRSARSQICCSTCLSEVSPRSTQPQQSSFSYTTSSRRGDESCPCRSCLQDNYGDSGAINSQPSSVCVNHDDSNPYEKSCEGSPRLSGGGSKEGGNYILCPSANQNPANMCCRGPGSVKNPGTSSRSGGCPAEMENHLETYGNNIKQLEEQLGSTESEVRNMQKELMNVHRERQQLEQQRKLLKCTGPCAPCSCCPPGVPHISASSHQPLLVPCVSGGPGGSSSTPQQQMGDQAPMLLTKMAHQQSLNSCSGVCINVPMGASTCPQQQLRDLREQYARLQEDYRNKLCEVSCLRADADKMKQETRAAKEERERADNRLEDVQARLKSMESEKLRFHGSKEQLVEQEQALLVAKQRYREAQDELEELRSLIQDQAHQLEDYRNKYLRAEEMVEEQRRQLDLMEMDNARMNENVNLEIGRVKNQFQDKLAELAPIPDILKQTQMKLHEVQQMRLVAERNCEDLSRELLTCKDKLGTMQSQLSALRSENLALQDQNGSGSGRCEELEKKNSELRSENERMKNAIARADENDSQLQHRLDEKMHEIVQLTAMLEQVREDSARQVARTKERCETVRKTMQGQIAEMEKQLAHCRATARAAHKDRDEIQQKMQGQINILKEAFEQAEGRIRSLQGHVNYLKTSYTNIFSPEGQDEGLGGLMTSETMGQGQGYDSCDCNF